MSLLFEHIFNAHHTNIKNKQTLNWLYAIIGMWRLLAEGEGCWLNSLTLLANTYCYSGIRRKTVLNMPLLPNLDLKNDPVLNTNNTQ